MFETDEKQIVLNCNFTSFLSSEHKGICFPLEWLLSKSALQCTCFLSLWQMDCVGQPAFTGMNARSSRGKGVGLDGIFFLSYSITFTPHFKCLPKGRKSRFRTYPDDCNAPHQHCISTDLWSNSIECSLLFKKQQQHLDMRSLPVLDRIAWTSTIKLVEKIAGHCSRTRTPCWLLPLFWLGFF